MINLRRGSLSAPRHSQVRDEEGAEVFAVYCRDQTREQYSERNQPSYNADAHESAMPNLRPSSARIARPAPPFVCGSEAVLYLI